MSKIRIFNQQKKFLIPKKSVTRQVEFLFNFFQIEADHIELLYVTKSYIQKLHKRFFDDDTPTDVITLPIDPIKKGGLNPCHLGEIVICPSIAMQEAKKRNLSFNEELSLYLVHGFLHLLGYDDMSEKEKKRMRKKEIFFMNQFRVKSFL